MGPAVSVIICHHTGRTLLQRCLASVALSRGVTWETIVVTSDPNYTNDAVDLYFLEDGPAAKRNLGVAHAHSNTIIFLDDDVEISPYCLYEFWTWLNDHSQCGMAFAKIYKMEEGRRDEFDDCGSWLTATGFLWARAGNHQRDVGQYNTPTPCLASKSATCGVRRTSYAACGGFDAHYYILGEETDLAWRMWLHGWEVWYVPTAIAWHAFGCESLKPKQEYYNDERIFYLGPRNYFRLLLTHLGIARVVWMPLLHLAGWLLASGGFALRGEWTRARLILRALGDTLRDAPALRHTRHRLQATRLVSDATLWPFIARSPGVRYYLDRLRRYLVQGYHG